MHQAVEAPKAALDFAHRGSDLARVGDVEFNHLTDLTELARGTPGQCDTATGTGQSNGGPFLQCTLGNAESERIVGQHAGNQDTVIGQYCHLVSVLKLNNRKGMT